MEMKGKTKMTNKRFYKCVLSKIIPFMFFIIFFFNGLYVLLKYKPNFRLMIEYCFFSISMILIIEIITSFFITISLLNKAQIENKQRVRFYLLIIPYIPSIISTFLYIFLLYLTKEITNYKRIFIICFGLTSSINFLFSMILNSRLKIFDLINDDNIAWSK